MLDFSQFQFIKTHLFRGKWCHKFQFGPFSPEKAFLFYWWSYHWCDAMPMRFVLNKIWHFTIPVQKRSQVVQIFIFGTIFPSFDVFWTKSGIYLEANGASNLHFGPVSSRKAFLFTIFPLLMCFEQNLEFLAHSWLVCQGCCLLTIAVVGTSSRLLTLKVSW